MRTQKFRSYVFTGTPNVLYISLPYSSFILFFATYFKILGNNYWVSSFEIAKSVTQLPKINESRMSFKILSVKSANIFLIIIITIVNDCDINLNISSLRSLIF